MKSKPSDSVTTPTDPKPVDGATRGPFVTAPVCGAVVGDPVSWHLEVRRAVAEFALAMEETLRRNDWKGGWKGVAFTTGDAMKRLYQEARELSDARAAGADSKKVMAEATDVANFAMMVWDRTRKELP